MYSTVVTITVQCLYNYTDHVHITSLYTHIHIHSYTIYTHTYTLIHNIHTYIQVLFAGTRDYDASFDDHTNTVRLSIESIFTDGKFQHSLEGLFPNTQYRVTVIPVNGAGRGMTSIIQQNTQNGE